MSEPLVHTPLQVVAVSGKSARPVEDDGAGERDPCRAEPRGTDQRAPDRGQRHRSGICWNAVPRRAAGLRGGRTRADRERGCAGGPASPVYRASFTGLFKHLFDFVGQYALVDTPVLLAATGGSYRHALIIEHQFRPLFGFFQALTLPLGVYANDSDFTGYRVSSLELHERIDQAVSRALPLIRAGVVETQPISG